MPRGRVWMEKADKRMAVALNEDEAGHMTVSLFVRNTLVDIPVEDVAETQYKPPVLMLNGSITLTTKHHEKYVVSVPFQTADELYARKLKIDELAKINAFEEGKFRSSYIFSADIMNYIPVLVVVPLGMMQVVAGILLFMVGPIGIVIGIVLILLGILIIVTVIRSSMNAVEGHCPICDKMVRTHLSAPYVYCTKCKEKVSVGNGFFEVK